MTDIYLIADDALPIVRLLQWRIQSAFGKGTDVRIASNGQEAAEKFLEIVQSGMHHHLVAVFMDYHMPICDGCESMRRIREVEKTAGIIHGVDIVGFSADITEEMNQLMIQGGATCILTKPPEPGALEELCGEIKQRKAAKYAGQS